MTTLRTALALSLAGSLLALGACSDDEPRPKIAPPESSSPTASQSASGAVPPKRLSQAQAVRRFFRQVSSAISTGDSAAFMSSASRHCQNCRVIAQNLADAYAKGGRIENGRWAVLRLSPVSQTSTGGVWDVDIRTAEERWLDRRGRLIKVVDPDTLTIKVVVNRSARVWEIRELRIA